MFGKDKTRHSRSKGHWNLSSTPCLEVKLAKCFVNRGICVVVKFMPAFFTHGKGDALVRTGLLHARHPKTFAVWPAHVLIFMSFYWPHFDSITKTRNCAKYGIQ